jgi:hypothetical protein
MAAPAFTVINSRRRAAGIVSEIAGRLSSLSNA